MHRRRARARRAVPLHVPDDRRLPRGEERARIRSATRTSSSSSATSAPTTTPAFYGLFVQDDWQITPQLKLLYGLRYDLFDVPAARPFAAEPVLAGLRDRQEQLRAARRPLVVARSAGAHGRARVDRADVRAAAARLLRQRDPEQRRSRRATTSVRCAGTAPGAPAFPASLAIAPPGFVLPRQSINAVDPDFRTQSAWLSNVQVERALEQRPRGLGRLRQLDRPQPAGADGRQPDPDRRDAAPTAGRSTHRRQRGTASIRRSTTSTCSSRSASPPTTRSPRR